MKKNKEISIIIPNWNGERQLKKNLPLLFNVLGEFRGKSEVIIIDDASTDKSRELLRELKKAKSKTGSKNLKVIFNDYNVGFAESVNRGVAEAQYNIVFLLTKKFY